jgi:hypothetical protein
MSKLMILLKKLQGIVLIQQIDFRILRKLGCY